MARKRIGEILIENGLIDEDGLRSALVEQRRRGGPIGRSLVELKLIAEDSLVAALSRQLAVPVVDLDGLEIPQAVIELIPGELAEAWGMVPFAQPMKFLDLAMTDPTNQRVLDELRVRTNLNIRAYLAGPKNIERAIGRFYGRGSVRGSTTSRRRETLEIQHGPDLSEMELVSAYDPAASRSIPAVGSNSPSTLSRPRIAASAVAAAAASGQRGPSYADLSDLQERIAALEALVRRDEDVLKKLMALLIEKGVATRDEIVARLS
jgi:type IV pilus assembly protein PilB